MDSDDIRRRLPSVPRKVNGISQNDVRVSVTGTVIDVSENGMVLDDDTGRISISFENRPNLKTGQLVRVFGRVMPAAEGVELRGEILQDMSGLDTALRKRSEALLKHI